MKNVFVELRGLEGAGGVRSSEAELYRKALELERKSWEFYDSAAERARFISSRPRESSNPWEMQCAYPTRRAGPGSASASADEGQVFLGRALAARGELGGRGERGRFRHLPAGV